MRSRKRSAKRDRGKESRQTLRPLAPDTKHPRFWLASIINATLRRLVRYIGIHVDDRCLVYVLFLLDSENPTTKRLVKFLGAPACKIKWAFLSLFRWCHYKILLKRGKLTHCGKIADRKSLSAVNRVAARWDTVYVKLTTKVDNYFAFLPVVENVRSFHYWVKLKIP